MRHCPLRVFIFTRGRRLVDQSNRAGAIKPTSELLAESLACAFGAALVIKSRQKFFVVFFCVSLIFVAPKDLTVAIAFSRPCFSLERLSGL